MRTHCCFLESLLNLDVQLILIYSLNLYLKSFSFSPSCRRFCWFPVCILVLFLVFVLVAALVLVIVLASHTVLSSSLSPSCLSASSTPHPFSPLSFSFSSMSMSWFFLSSALSWSFILFLFFLPLFECAIVHQEFDCHPIDWRYRRYSGLLRRYQARRRSERYRRGRLSLNLTITPTMLSSVTLITLHTDRNEMFRTKGLVYEHFFMWAKR